MSKELRAFRKICKNLNSYEFTDEYKKNKKLIETALKNYAELTNRPVILCGRTHGYTQALIDTICKNYKEVKITNLEDEKKLKVLEIIKELFDFDFAIRFGDNQPMIKITNKRNGQYWELPETTEICDLLKEVLIDG